MSEWGEVELVDLCAKVTSGGTPARSHPEYYTTRPNGYPWVKSSELRDGYIGATEEQISDLGLQNSAAKLLPPDTVLVAMYGVTAGRVGLLKAEAALNQAICALVPDRDRADSVFLFHALRAQYEALSGKAAGAAQQNLNAGIVKAFRLPIPSIATQRRIAAVLSAFDELIEINERRIELLEDLARSLHREWFVHFRFPGRDDAQLVESKSGPLPAGWHTVGLNHVADITMGQSPRSEFYNEAGTGLPFHQGVSDFGRLLPTNSKYCTAEMRTAERLDVLCSVRAPVGRLNIAGERLGIGRGLSSIRRHDGAQAFLMLQLRQALGAEDSIGGGTIYKAIGKAQLAELSVLEPESPWVKRFETVARPMLDLRVELTELNRQLVLTRDLLLPRLVTGQLDIFDIDLGVLAPVEIG